MGAAGVDGGGATVAWGKQGGGGGIQPLKTAFHINDRKKYKSSKQFLWIAYMETSELEGSKRT